MTYSYIESQKRVLNSSSSKMKFTMCTLALLVVQVLLVNLCNAQNALGLTDKEVESLKHVTDLYEKTISYKHNLHEIMKPFLQASFRAEAQKTGDVEEAVSALFLEPVRLLDDAKAFDAWVQRTKAQKPFRPRTNQKVLEEIVDLLEMSLNDKFTPEYAAIVKKAGEKFISSLTR